MLGTMLERLRRLPRRTIGLLVAAALVALPIGAVAVQSLALLVIGGRLRHAAGVRGLEASWESLRFGAPFTVHLRGLAVSRPARRDTLFRADSLTVALDPWALLVFRARPSRVELAHARLGAPGGGAADADTLSPAEGPPRRATAERLRRTAENLARLALAPARSLPELRLRDVSVEGAPSTESAAGGAWVARLDLARERGGVRLECAGRLALERDVPFEATLDYARDDRLAGRLWFGVPDSARRRTDSLIVRIAGAASQDRRRGELSISDDTRVWIGELPLRLGGRVARSGPRLSLALAADGLTQALIERSIPAPLLGPLTRLSVEGSFDYRLDLDLDVARPDSVRLTVDVVPHGLAINADGTELPILGLDEPFTAAIHLPQGRSATRELSGSNPFYRPLEDIDSTLVYAVVTNEDGGFFRHRGFNLEAVRGAIAENLRAGAYRRGAGTITMQLARNLWLGHQRTLSRKAQEVVLAWVLEHLTGLSKQRLLEIYLNIVEWGPGIHGAAEATHFYFDRDPGRLTPAQALFLTTLLPSPNKWRYRFGKDGQLRPSTRAQMRFIGRAMAGKGWLDPAALPAAESLGVEITGPARAVLFPDSTVLAGPPAAAPAGAASPGKHMR